MAKKLTPGKKAAQTRKRRATAMKAVTTKKRRATAKKAVQTRKRNQLAAAAQRGLDALDLGDTAKVRAALVEILDGTS